MAAAHLAVFTSTGEVEYEDECVRVHQSNKDESDVPETCVEEEPTIPLWDSIWEQ